MEIVGIVAEYNPFHNGHRHQIAQARALAGAGAVVCAMSGNFVQRGDCAVTDKWTRARMALEGGADLILELPTVWASSSAETFARGSVEILHAAGAAALSFGSETGDGAALEKVAQVLDDPAFSQALQPFLSLGLPFAQCRHRAVQELVGEEAASCLANANDNLGVEYLRAARRLGWSPKVYPVLRVGAGHDGGDHPLYPSASHVRGEIRTGAVTMDNPAFLSYNQRGMLARLRCLELEDWERIPDCGEGLAQRLYRAVRQGTSLEEIYDLAKTKRYAHARIRRAVLWGALGLREQDRPAQVPYLRVLGANERGLGVLRNLDGSIPVITKPTHGKGIPLMELEARCTDFYALCRETVTPCGAEWSTSPVILQKSGNHV